MTAPNRVEEWIGKHLWNIVTIIAIGSGAYFAAQTKTGMAVDDLRARVDVLESHDNAASIYRHCNTRVVDALRHGDKEMPCDLGDKE